MPKEPRPPDYKIYRARPALLDRLAPARDEPALGVSELERSGRGARGDGRGGGGRGAGGGATRPPAGRRMQRPGAARRRWPRLTWRRGLLALLAAIVGWLVLSLVLFLISAQTQTSGEPASVTRALDGGGLMLTSAQNILILGSDARPVGTHEPGATVIGQPSRSDTIMVVRAGGGSSARLSIPRDTVIDLPGHGLNKINAAYAYGGAALAITTIKRYLGIPINHIVEVNFTNFPKFVDALGGITYSGPCVDAVLDGGASQGGTTLRLKAGTHHLNGKQALAISRVRHNACDPNETDLTRIARQQRILTAIKQQLLSPWTFFRLPWVAWTAPQAIKSDMGGPTLLQLFASLAIAGSPPVRILRPTGVARLPDGEVGLTVSQADKQAAVRQLMGG